MGLWSSLEDVLAITPEVEADDMVVERLAKIAAAMPTTAIRCLNFMVKGAKDYWRTLKLLGRSSGDYCTGNRNSD